MHTLPGSGVNYAVIGTRLLVTEGADYLRHVQSGFCVQYTANTISGKDPTKLACGRWPMQPTHKHVGPPGLPPRDICIAS